MSEMGEGVGVGGGRERGERGRRVCLSWGGVGWGWREDGGTPATEESARLVKHM